MQDMSQVLAINYGQLRHIVDLMSYDFPIYETDDEKVSKYVLLTEQRIQSGQVEQPVYKLRHRVRRKRYPTLQEQPELFFEK
jgi:hypothetical protein